MFELPEKYKSRIVIVGDALRVYGDKSRVVMLGVVSDTRSAMALLDGYDMQIARRRYIADKIMKENSENEDAKQITKRLNNDIR